ncbi:hypothetical protein LX16_3403 [Stackebrandtia albiflava]|uniref:Uncharacterized protein n=1 Tax=Stackebrandtia albiflava TaxID=406432 RepID=A0A562V424_9ACTN|nr:hypothetical protein [Stackebrandtia albiflava]TWJ12641.1 hypothetical protein LX16_3403 [Stackebrandtia albiflava]
MTTDRLHVDPAAIRDIVTRAAGTAASALADGITRHRPEPRPVTGPPTPGDAAARLLDDRIDTHLAALDRIRARLQELRDTAVALSTRYADTDREHAAAVAAAARRLPD